MQSRLNLYKIVITGLAAIMLLVSVFFLSGNDNNPVIKWHQRVIRIEDRGPWGYSTQIAVSKWNQARIGISFVIARDRPDIIIEGTDKFMSSCNHPTTVGCSKVGRYNFLGMPQKIQLRNKPQGFQDQGQMSSVVAHELGHALGLRHPQKEKGKDGRCVLMSRSNNCRSQTELKMIINNQDQRGTQAHSIDRRRQDRKITFETTHHLICGPSDQELRLLKNWYHGPGPNLDSWDTKCSFNESKARNGRLIKGRNQSDRYW